MRFARSEVMQPDVDIDAYFQRIGYGGSRQPTLETLRALHALHPGAIPFENLNPLLHLPVDLDLGSLQRKLVEQRRELRQVLEQNFGIALPGSPMLEEKLDKIARGLSPVGTSA